MGPYYLSALVNLLRPARRVAASARVTFPGRTITSEPKQGQTVSVTPPTPISGVLDIMQALLESSDAARHIELTSACQRPDPMPTTSGAG